jgi:hypothetical protein
MSDPVRTPRRGIRRVVAVALGGAVLASALAIGPISAFGGDPGPVFSVQPLGATAWNAPTGQPNQAWSIQPQVTMVGDVDPSYDYQATLSISPGSPYGNLSCFGGTTVDMIGGSARWSGCSIDTPGQGYTLTATVFGTTAMGVVLPPMQTTSYAFNIAGGGPTPGSQSLQFTTQPLGANLGSARPVAQAGRAWSIQPVVALVDQDGRPVNNSSTVVQLSITTGTPQSGGPGRLTCSGGTATTLQNGFAYFQGCSIDTPGTAYQLTASTVSFGSTQVLYDISLPFDISGGNYATQIRFSTQPLGAVQGGNVPSGVTGTPWSIQPSVALYNSSGKIVSSDYTSLITLSLDPSGPAGQLYCSTGTSVQVSAGIAYFQGCQVVGTGNGYRLLARAQTTTGNLGPTYSLPFNITAAPSGLDLQASAYEVAPGTTMTFTATLSGAGAGGQTIIFEGTNAYYPQWTQFGTAVTNSAGVATLTPSKGIQYTATVRARFAGSGNLAPATSTSDVIGVTAALTISPGGTNNVTKGSSVTYTATLKPNPGSGQRVQFLIYQYVNGVWTYNNQRTYFTDGNSQVKLTWKWSTAGKWYVRAYAAANVYYTDGYSPTSIVNVK